MTIKISAAHRDAIYDAMLDRLSGIGDLWLVVAGGDFEAADRLGRDYSDDLRLILDDLGWGDGAGRSIELTAPAEILERVFTRLREKTDSLRESEASELAEVRDRLERIRLVTEICDDVLKQLELT